MDVEHRIKYFIEQRSQSGLLRKLAIVKDKIDFSSNDYLGFSRSALIRQRVEEEYNQYRNQCSGATGSRLLNGNFELHETVEQLLAAHFHAESAVLFNSGFDANVGLIATVARPEDYIFYDELVHASIHQGMTLSGATLVAFKHNNLEDLETKLAQIPPSFNRFIVTESVFSMEGDKADLHQIANLSAKYNAKLVVDEAHATGIFGSFGSGLCNEQNIENRCFARVYTFGKAMGGHGAVVVGAAWLKTYLINFSKNFIYTTATDTHTLLSVKHSIFMSQFALNKRNKLLLLIQYFIDKIRASKLMFEVRGEGPIFGIITPQNDFCRNFAHHLQQNGLDVRPILSPTVPMGSERLRVILHSFNTKEEIDFLISLLIDYK